MRKEKIIVQNYDYNCLILDTLGYKYENKQNKIPTKRQWQHFQGDMLLQYHAKLFPCCVSIGKLIHMIRFYFLFDSFPLQSSLLSGWGTGSGRQPGAAKG